jgi:hypothetical protein
VSQPPANTGALVAGIVVGLFIGGTVLALILFVLLGATVDQFSKNQGLVFVCEYVVAVLIGLGAMVAVRRSVGFGSGLLVGLAAGLFGGAAFCNLLVGGLNNMH